MSYLKNIYTLVEELNESTNKKFDLLLTQGGLNTYQILSQLTLLNQSYEKLTEAYTPEPFEKPVIEDPRYKGQAEFYPVDDFGNRIDTTNPQPQIQVKKKTYDDDQYEY